MNSSYIAYLRVSTPRQGETGVSLSEQRLDIEGYAQAHGLRITRWFTEIQSAASSTRPVFRRVVELLRTRTVTGLIVHKIDRSARNLTDWSTLGTLIDTGADIRFVRDNLDLRSRGGRLAADIQAVIAADYIRNLREETRKGIRGRFRQGLYPLPAPLGYMNNGRGRLKTVDPDAATLVAYAFRSYATGTVTLRELRLDTFMKGLRNRNGKPVSINGWSRLLKNPFYAGRLLLRSTGEEFEGKHEPLVSHECFNRVQVTLRSRSHRRIAVKHYFRYRRLLQCGGCQRNLVGENQKGRVYYRCHSRDCRGISVREDRIEGALAERLIVMRNAESSNVDTGCAEMTN